MRGIMSLRVLAVLLSTVLLPGTRATAQERTCSFLCAPVFVFQPGVIVTDFLDKTEVSPGVEADTKTEFLFRMVTAIPTAASRVTLVGILQWTPLDERDDGGKANAPSFVYGPVFSLVNAAMWSLDFDVLGSYSPAAEADDESDYTHKLVLEADAQLKIGRWMVADSNNRFRDLALYAFLAYVATGIPDEASPWALLAGLSLPIAPW
jgi:hypothetical protein